MGELRQFCNDCGISARNKIGLLITGLEDNCGIALGYCILLDGAIYIVNFCFNQINIRHIVSKNGIGIAVG